MDQTPDGNRTERRWAVLDGQAPSRIPVARAKAGAAWSGTGCLVWLDRLASLHHAPPKREQRISASSAGLLHRLDSLTDRRPKPSSSTTDRPPASPHPLASQQPALVPPLPGYRSGVRPGPPACRPSPDHRSRPLSTCRRSQPLASSHFAPRTTKPPSVHRITVPAACPLQQNPRALPHGVIHGRTNACKPALQIGSR